MRFSIFPPRRHLHLCGGVGVTLTGNSPLCGLSPPVMVALPRVFVQQVACRQEGRAQLALPFRLSMQLLLGVSVGALLAHSLLSNMHRQESNLRQN